MSAPAEVANVCGRCHKEFKSDIRRPLGVARCDDCEELVTVAAKAGNAKVTFFLNKNLSGRPVVRNMDGLVKIIKDELENTKRYIEQTKKHPDQSIQRALEREKKELEEALDALGRAYF